MTKNSNEYMKEYMRKQRANRTSEQIEIDKKKSREYYLEHKEERLNYQRKYNSLPPFKKLIKKE